MADALINLRPLAPILTMAGTGLLPKRWTNRNPAAMGRITRIGGLASLGAMIVCLLFCFGGRALSGELDSRIEADGVRQGFAAIGIIVSAAALMLDYAVRLPRPAGSNQGHDVAALNAFYIGAWIDRVLLGLWPIKPRGRPRFANEAGPGEGFSVLAKVRY